MIKKTEIEKREEQPIVNDEGAVVGEMTEETTAVVEPTDEAEKPKVGKSRMAEYMRSNLGDSYVEDDEDGNTDRLLEVLNRRDTRDRELAEMMIKDPRVAAIIGSIKNGKSAPAAFARFLGREFMDAQEGTPEYDEIMAADAEHRAEAERLLEEERKYDENIERTMPILEEYCRKNHKDASDFKQQLYDKIIFPVLSGEYTEELCEIVLHGLDYDQDIADATEAGRVMGRNENIETLREERESKAMTQGFGSANVRDTDEGKKMPKRHPLWSAIDEA